MNFTKIASVIMFGCTSILFGVKEAKSTHKQKSVVRSEQSLATKSWSEHKNDFILETAHEVAQKQLGRLECGNPFSVKKTIDVGNWNFHYLTLTAVVLESSDAPRLGLHEIYRDGNIAVTAKTVLYV
jgi:hypothetical protein